MHNLSHFISLTKTNIVRRTKNIKNGNDKFKDNMEWNKECGPVNGKLKVKNRWWNSNVYDKKIY